MSYLFVSCFSIINLNSVTKNSLSVSIKCLYMPDYGRWCNYMHGRSLYFVAAFTFSECRPRRSPNRTEPNFATCLAVCHMWKWMWKICEFPRAPKTWSSKLPVSGMVNYEGFFTFPQNLMNFSLERAEILWLLFIHIWLQWCDWRANISLLSVPWLQHNSMGQIIKSVCVCQCICQCICPSASTLTVAFLDRF